MAIDSRKIYKIYKALDKDQIQFVLDKKIAGTYSIRIWLDRLLQIAELDTLGDDTRQKSGSLSIVFGTFTLFTIILTISKPFMFFFPIGFFLIFFYFLFTNIALSKIDIGNNLRIFVVPLLKKYLDERNIKEELKLRMDFSSPIASERLTATVESKSKDRNKVYKHHWMEGSIQYNDGVKITWEIEDIVKKIERNLQDKATNMDMSSIFNVDHILNMHFYAPVARFDSINKELMESKDGEFYILSIHKKDISNSLDEGMDPQTFIAAVEEGYKKLKLKSK